MLLWRAHGNPLTSYPIPEDFAAAVNAGIAIVGTPDEVTDGLKREIDVCRRELHADAVCVRRSHA